VAGLAAPAPLHRAHCRRRSPLPRSRIAATAAFHPRAGEPLRRCLLASKSTLTYPSKGHTGGPQACGPFVTRRCRGKLPPLGGAPKTTKAPHTRGFRECAEEDSNFHPVIPDQALNLVTRLSDTSYASIASRTSADLDASDAMDDLDVATDVATSSRVRELDPALLLLAQSGTLSPASPSAGAKRKRRGTLTMTARCPASYAHRRVQPVAAAWVRSNRMASSVPPSGGRRTSSDVALSAMTVRPMPRPGLSMRGLMPWPRSRT
jgi:hypothetical protein